MKTILTIAHDPWEHGALKIATDDATEIAEAAPADLAKQEHALRLSKLLRRYEAALVSIS